MNKYKLSKYKGYVLTGLIILLILIWLFYFVSDSFQYFENETLGAPLIFQVQLYPRNPLLPEEGKKCTGNNECGAVGECFDGVCRLKQYTKTVFDIDL